MKKNFKWLINLATLVLCVCALAIGVYAAKQASLTATGTIGFTAHGCKVKVSGTIDAYDEDFTTKLTGTEATIAETLVDEEGKELPLPAMYFSDLAEEGNTITINLKITSDSDFAVLCNIPNPVAYDSTATTIEITSVRGVTSHQSFVLSTKGEYKDITIKFTLTDIETAADITATFDANLEFKKYTFDRSALKLADTANSDTGLDVGNLYVEMGEYNSTPLKWYAFGYSASGSEEMSTGNMTTLDGTVFTDTTSTNVPEGTYFFISEYALGTSTFHDTYSGDPAEMEYNGSPLYTAINALATSSTYKIGTSTLYNQIVARNLAGGDYTFYDGWNDDPGDYETIETRHTNSSTNQMLWALSYDEAYILLRNGTDANAKTADMTTGGTAACGWWLRSPSSCDSFNEGSGARFVNSSALNSNNFVNYDYGVRAAFKLVIA
ncbi:MAG: hypothetical protein E7376_01940 [Clostridiales bacterium]|nr:hypothetical protein [Clostridiales bacterium]